MATTMSFRVNLHGFAELVAAQLVLADFEIGVGQVLADGGAARGGFDSLEETRDRGVVVARAQRLVSARKRLVSRVRSLGESQPAYCKKTLRRAYRCQEDSGGQAGDSHKNFPVVDA